MIQDQAQQTKTKTAYCIDGVQRGEENNNVYKLG